jgi:mannan endo-1,4-beta-mannosidase
VLLFQLVADNLHWMKTTGGPMAGAMFWNAAVGNVWDDGYVLVKRGETLPHPDLPATMLACALPP